MNESVLRLTRVCLIQVGRSCSDSGHESRRAAPRRTGVTRPGDLAFRGTPTPVPAAAAGGPREAYFAQHVWGHGRATTMPPVTIV